MREEKRSLDSGIDAGVVNGIFKNKKGQITVFIIIGILMLAAFGGIMYFTKSTTESKLESEQGPTITSVPSKFQPLQTYTENCVLQVGKQGLLVLGQQGGYIYPEVLGEYSSSNPTDSVGINLESAKVPYWYYNTEKDGADKVVYASFKPELNSRKDEEMSVEAQLARYVKDKISVCLNDYAPFREQSFEIDIPEEQEIISQVKIGENGVNFWYTMNVKVVADNVEGTLGQFNVYIPVPLKHYYEIASLITEAQQNYSFLEKQGLELLSVYSKVDMNYFPPISDVTYDAFSTYSWSESVLQTKMQEVLTSYVPMLRYFGSSNFYRATFPEGELLAQKVADNMILMLFGADDLQINFDYLGWRPYFKANSEDGIIKPEVISINPFNLGVASFSQQRYETHYDISYPVLVTLYDAYAFDGESYTFNFALESNIRNNAPAVANEEVKYYPKKVTSLTCNEEQRNTELLKTVVVDSFSKEPVELVKIGFSVPELSNCDMGVTDDKGEFESKYPAAYGGVVSYMKPEYLTDFYPINTYEYKDKKGIIGYAVSGMTKEVTGSDKVIELHKIVPVNVTIKKKELKECVTPLTCKYVEGVVGVGIYVPYKDISCNKGKEQCFFNRGSNLLKSTEPVYRVEVNSSKSKYHDFYFMNQELSLSNSERAVINLQRMGGMSDEVVSADFNTFLDVKGKEVISVNLVPGVYKVTGTLINENNLEIPTEKRCTGFDILTGESEECQLVNGSNITNFVSGGINLDEEGYYVTITPEDLYTAKQITFYVISQDILSTPPLINSTDEKCAKVMVADACEDEKVQVSGRIAEIMGVSSAMGEISKITKVRSAVEPKYE